MAREIFERDISALLGAATHWIQTCLVADGSVFSATNLWATDNLADVQRAFVDHPDHSDADFMTKLNKQMVKANPKAQQLAAEMLWALLLFPSNIKPQTKRWQIEEIWSLSGSELITPHLYLSDEVLQGVGSGGPAFNNYRPDELSFLIFLAADLKRTSVQERRAIFSDYDKFMNWIGKVPRQGNRQFRHMLRYFAFPDRVERISSNNDRRTILERFGVSDVRVTKDWSDQQLDAALADLRTQLQPETPGVPLDFYEPKLKSRWSPDQKVKTPEGTREVVIPLSELDEVEETGDDAPDAVPPEARQSFQVQAKLAEIGVAIGYGVWIPRGDLSRVAALMAPDARRGLLEQLPVNYDLATNQTIEQIDVIWIRNRSIVRAFEVEQTTSVYSGLLRMADLLALQPNINILLHIVAPDERREKVFREMRRPVFALFENGSLADRCTFLSYDSVNQIREIKQLTHMNHTVLNDFEERAPNTG